MPESLKDPVEWLAAARAGSHHALGQGLETYRRYLLQVAQQELGPDLRTKGGASDMVQETFLEAYRDFSHFRGNSEAEVRAWLRQLLLHHLGKLARKYATAKRQLGCEVPLDAGGSSGERGGGLGANMPSPSGEAIQREEAQALQRVLARLPDDYRRVIVLHHEEKRTFGEIGHLMQRSPEAVRKVWARAVIRLKQEMGTPP